MFGITSVSSGLIVLLAVIGASSIMINESATKPPLMFSKWPPAYQNNKSPSLRQQIFHQLRSSGRIPSSSMIVKRYPSPMPFMMRPMKYAQLKKTPLPQMPQPQPSYYKPTISTPPRYRFHSSPSAPNTGEYIFENPFGNIGIPSSKKKFSLTDDTKYNPIHTVPAPNLNKNLAYSTHNEYIHEPVDNQIFDQKDPTFNQITFRPLTIPQYQVTEQINDHTIRVDPFSGKQKFYASEPDQTAPSYKITQTFDSFNQPSRPLPIEISFVPAQSSQSQSNTAPVASPLIQLSNQVPQQQLPDTYGLPIGNQPQLQQHLLQQQSMLQNMPVSVYNPTYLVTQSNNLLKQHREQLFKPAPAYLGTINQPSIDLSPGNSQPLQDVNSVASPGQLLTSAQSQQKQLTQQPTQSQSPSQSPQSNAIPLRTDFTSSLPQTDNSPTFQRFVADRPPSIVFAQQPALTESELNNLLNIGHHENDDTNRFIASTYYQSQPDPQLEIENRQRQQLNDLTIAQANQELKDKFISPEPIKVNARKPTAHQEHQQKLAEQLSSKSPLRIYVPDEEYQKKNEVRRSDFFRAENKNDFILSKSEYAIDNPYMNGNNEEQDNNDNDNDTTTDGNDDYLAHDTESVDRLSLDGETREPINSSTIGAYNF